MLAERIDESSQANGRQQTDARIAPAHGQPEQGQEQRSQTHKRIDVRADVGEYRSQQIEWLQIVGLVDRIGYRLIPAKRLRRS